MAMPDSTIAFVTDDGTTISSHFGRALYYEIVSLKDGQVGERRRVEKAGHHSFGAHEHGEGGHHGAQAHGDGGHHNDHKHAAMTAPLAGVAVLVSRGMGVGAQQHLLASGIQPILTDLRSIDEAVQHYIAGTLAHNPKRLHDHGPHPQ
ncbi:MAG: dinitrogenase iron-molybdenum cofactor biosynthesis protein [Bacteroidetes bacterium]|nr:dinitrogenase iron-molybdenum cofactor biosynthesis protein [Bacteroidota bacterium]